MKINDAFPSDYIKGSEVERPVLFVMSHVDMRDVGDDLKPVLFFIGQEKGMVLNKGNAQTISEAYGENTEGWQGKQIVIYFNPDVMYAGKRTGGIRVRKPKVASKPAPAPEPAPTTVDEDMSDEIPF
jgi:hypothetical protein